MKMVLLPRCDPNPDYRIGQWGYRDWSSRAPYTGVFLDNSRPLGDYGPIHNPAGLPLTGWKLDWTMLVGPNKVVAYNLGLNQFFDTVRGQFPHLIYNGIGRRDWMPLTNPRNLELLMHAEGAMNEGFCFDRSGTVDVLYPQEDMIADIAIMRSAADAGKMMLQKVNHGMAPAKARFCLGSFLLGHSVGRTFFKYGPDYREREIGSDPPEVAVDFGIPLAEYSELETVGTADGGVGSLFGREFERGLVLVNMADVRITTSASFPVVLMNEVPAKGTRFDAGAPLQVPPQDALFLQRFQE